MYNNNVSFMFAKHNVNRLGKCEANLIKCKIKLFASQSNRLIIVFRKCIWYGGFK